MNQISLLILRFGSINQIVKPAIVPIASGTARYIARGDIGAFLELVNIDAEF